MKFVSENRMMPRFITFIQMIALCVNLILLVFLKSSHLCLSKFTICTAKCEKVQKLSILSIEPKSQ